MICLPVLVDLEKIGPFDTTVRVSKVPELDLVWESEALEKHSGFVRVRARAFRLIRRWFQRQLIWAMKPKDSGSGYHIPWACKISGLRFEVMFNVCNDYAKVYWWCLVYVDGLELEL